MDHKIDPTKIVIKFSSTARQTKQRQNTFNIPKPYIDDGYIVIGIEYDIYVVKKDG